jgi:hypothetical protein
VRRRPASVKQAGLGQDKGAVADRRDAARAILRRTKKLEQACCWLWWTHPGPDDQRVDLAGFERHCLDNHAERGGDRTTGLGEDTDLIECLAGKHVRELEHRGRCQRHHLEPWDKDKPDALHEVTPVACPKRECKRLRGRAPAGLSFVQQPAEC